MRRVVVTFVGLLLGACASPVPAPIGEKAPADFPAAEYAELTRAGELVLRVDPEHSIVVIEVRRAGSLASLGHDHLVAGRAVHGLIAPQRGRGDFYIALDALEVDEPALRADAGMETTPSAADVAGTRRNMLDAVLQTGAHPFARVTVRNAPRLAGAGNIPVEVTLHGVTRSVNATTDVTSGPLATVLTCAFSINQSDFGIVAYSLLGGAVAVRDRVDLRVRLLAHPL